VTVTIGLHSSVDVIDVQVQHFTPRQKAVTFDIDQVMDKMTSGDRGSN
jgi:hypothetical protein